MFISLLVAVPVAADLKPDPPPIKLAPPPPPVPQPPPTPAPQPPPPPPPVVIAPAAPAPRVTPPPAAKQKARQTRRKARRAKPKVAQPSLVIRAQPPRLAAEAGPGSSTIALPFLLAGCTAAILMLALALTPARAVPWSRASDALDDHRDELGLVGALSLAATMVFFLLVQVTK
jgi:hypothetical protein